MKLLKSLLSIAVLLCVISLDAKQMGGAPAYTATPPSQPAPTMQQPIQQPIQRPSMKEQSYAQALNAIKMHMSPDKVVMNNTLTPNFIKFVQSLNLSAIETKALLEAGANIHAIWTDNNEINKKRLLSFNNDIRSIVQAKPAERIIPITPIIPAKPIEQPVSIAIPKPVIPVEKPISVEVPKPAKPAERIKPITPIIPVKPIEQPAEPIMPAPSIEPIEQPAPIEEIKPATPAEPTVQPRPTEPQTEQIVPRDLLGKVKKLEGYDDIYIGAGISAEKEPIFFAMEKLNDERAEVWKKYTDALLNSYYTQVTARLNKLNKKCDDKVFLETLDDYTKNLMKQMCPRKEKFSTLFGSSDDGISGGITGLDQMLARYSDDGKVIYIVYASSQPITGPFKPKKEINVSSFTLEDFEIAYSDLIICMGVDMLQNLKLPISTEHRGIFKNPFNEIQGTYKNIGLKLHGFAGAIEEQFFNKKYMTVFPTGHATKLFHSGIKKGEMYLGTDKKPFPYKVYYKNDAEIKAIKEKFPPINQELIGDAPTTPSGAGTEYLHVLPLNSLSKYYTLGEKQ